VVTFNKSKDLCIINKHSGDETLNHVLHRYTPLSVELLGPTTPRFSKQIDGTELLSGQSVSGQRQRERYRVWMTSLVEWSLCF